MEVHVTLTTLAVFVILFIVFLVGLLFYLYPGSGKSSSMPGPNPSDAKEGNISDLRKAGSLQEYLSELHNEYGDVTTFWHGSKQIVSVANREHFAPRSQIFEIPDILFEGWRPLVGDSSFIFSQGVDIFSRRDKLDFTVNTKTKQHYGTIFTKMSKELVKKWASLPEGQHIPLTQHVRGLATKAVCRMLFGDYFRDDTHVIKLHKAWEHCWTYIESLAREEDPVSLKKDFQSNLKVLEKVVEEAMNERFQKGSKSEPVILDGILSSSGDSASNDKILISDAITQLTIGMHVTHSVLLWLVYYIATHTEVQKKLRKELQKNKDLEIMPETIAKMAYLQCILKETVRCGAVFSWAARQQDIDITIDGHVVSKNTPVIEAIGEAMCDEKDFADPSLFDPNRFSSPSKDKVVKDDLNPLGFLPFAFAGSRKKPEDSLVYLLGSILICNVTNELVIGIAGDTAQNSSDPDYTSFVSKPSKEELWAVVAPIKEAESVGKKE